MEVLIIILIPATLLLTAWLLLLGRVSREDWVMAAYSKAYDNYTAIDKLRVKDRVRDEKLSKLKGIASIGPRLLLGGDTSATVRKLTQCNEALQRGNLKSINLFTMPGYVLQREFEAIGKSGIHAAILKNSNELYGKKHSPQKARHLLAQLMSYPMIGIAGSAALGSIVMAAGNAAIGATIMGVGTALILVLVYAKFDDLNDRVKKRRASIGKQFPNVVSKLALLVTSGMIMDKAWKITAHSRDDDLYMEMRLTSDEIDNLVSPEMAYSNFINRCNTKETAKLAAAIMQNISKGNAEIGRLLKEMAREAWLERRHKAKREAEKANSKLMIPTMMLFLAILVMLMMPVAMSFSGI